MSSGVSLSYIEDQRMIASCQFQHDPAKLHPQYTQTHLVYHTYITSLGKQQKGNLMAPYPGRIMQRSTPILQEQTVS